MNWDSVKYKSHLKICTSLTNCVKELSATAVLEENELKVFLYSRSIASAKKSTSMRHEKTELPLSTLYLTTLT